MQSSQPLILFDGVCNLCNWLTPFVRAREGKTHFAFAPLQSAEGQAALARFKLPSAFDSMVLVDGDRCLTRSDAVLGIVRRLKFPWPVLSGLRIVPRAVRDSVYKGVAKNRYKWFGKADQCSL